MTPEEQQKLALILYQLVEPKLNWSIGALNLIKLVEVDAGKLKLRIDVVADEPALMDAFRSTVFAAVEGFGFSEIDLELGKANIATHGLDGVKHIILVGSGKGGVGKSTIAVNLAQSLQMKGLQVGVMDADIYGPSVPILLGSDQKPQVLAEECLLPLEAHGMKFLSTGNLVAPDKALAWRGQLVSGTLLQFIRKTAWGELDYLIVDLPPGTGDVQLTIAAELKVDGIVVVSMPQEVVLGDVRRSLSMYKEKGIPILGVVQNMVSYQCEGCGHEQVIFPAGKDHLHGVETLAAMPLDRDLCDSGNQGRPFVLDAEGVAKDKFTELADFILNQQT